MRRNLDGRALHIGAPPDPGTLFNAADVLHASPLAVAVLDRDWRFAYLNARAESYVGRSESVLGRDVFDVLPELTGSAFETALRAATRGLAPVRLDRFENPLSRRCFQVWLLPSRSCVTIHFSDVTHLANRQKQQAAVAAFGLHALLAQNLTREALLTESMKAVRDALNLDFAGLFMSSGRDAEAQALLTAGSGWQEGLVGVYSESLRCGSHVAKTFVHADPISFNCTGNDLSMLFADTQLIEQHGVRSGLSAAVQSAEGLHGVIVAYSTSDRNFSSDDLNCLQSIANAIAGLHQYWEGATALEQSELRLRQAQKMEAVGRLAGGIAHDFNNLLTVINSYSELAMASLVDNAELHADVEQIRTAAQRAASLTRQLLAFSRRQILVPREIDLNEVVEGLQKMLLRVIGADVALDVELDADPALVFADPGQVEQVLMNLVLNSRDAMAAGGRIVISSRSLERDQIIHLKWSDAVPGRYVEIAVSDNGSGIPADVLPHVFEPFFSTKDRSRGTGLGLSTVYGIITQSGGYVRAESSAGLGTTMRIILPLHRPVAATDADQPALVQVSRGGGESVLLVEDDDSVRKLARRVLARAGYVVTEATNGVNALALFSEDSGPQFDLVLTDIVMPGMNGRALVRELSRRNKVPRVLFMSGYTEDEVVRHDLLPPGTLFMEKPFSVEALLLSVRRALQ